MCSPCVTAVMVPSDWGEPDPSPGTYLLMAVQAGGDEDVGMFAVVYMGRSRGISAYSHLFYSAIALTLFFCGSESAACGLRFVKLSSDLSNLFA